MGKLDEVVYVEGPGQMVLVLAIDLGLVWTRTESDGPGRAWFSE